MSRSAQDFQGELQALLPPGDAWPRDPNSLLAQLLLAVGDGLAAVDASAEGLLDEADPRTTLYLLPDWERVAGLPDPCAGPAPTIAARRAQLVARLTSEGGQSIAIITAYLAALGYTVTISEFYPFTVGVSGVGDPGSPVCDQDWQFVFAINAPLNTVQYFCPGISAAGEPLASWGNEVLECETQRIAPAHTIPIFLYS
jgi:uncharacterized protein YmfQ (DUF2313 family)